METKTIIELAVGAVAFAALLTAYIFVRKNINGGELTKKQKRKKKLLFMGVIISGWFVLGTVITAVCSMKGKLAIEFDMFSERVNFGSFTLAKTTIIALCVSGLIVILAVLFRVFAVPKFSADKPKGLQNIVEICVEAVDSFTAKAVGEKSAAFLSPYMFSLALFMLGCAMSELMGLRAPTSDLTCTFAMGLCTFVLLNIFGFKRLGFAGRLKSMGGSVPAMRPIMIPLKMVSDIAVPVSLACRLFGNMMGGMLVMDLLKGVLGGYASGLPAIAGLYFNLFHPMIQIYIFITLSLTFINEAQE